jgi:hypothetical protein
MPNPYGHPVWWLWTILVAFPMVVYGCTLTPTFPQALLLFLSGSFLVFVSTAAAFKENFVKRYHFLFAGVCAACSLAYIGFIAPFYLIVPGILGSMFVFYGLGTDGVNKEKVKRNAVTFYLEMVCFVSLYLVLFLEGVVNG